MSDTDSLYVIKLAVASAILESLIPEITSVKNEISEVRSEVADYHAEIKEAKAIQEKQQEEIKEVKEKVKDYPAVRWICYAVGTVAITAAGAFASGLVSGKEGKGDGDPNKGIQQTKAMAIPSKTDKPPLELVRKK